MFLREKFSPNEEEIINIYLQLTIIFHFYTPEHFHVECECEIIINCTWNIVISVFFPKFVFEFIFSIRTSL